MNNDKMLGGIGKKVFEELEKQKEDLDKSKHITARRLFDSELMDERSHLLQQDETLQENFKKTLGKLRSEKIKLDMEIIEHKKDN